MDNNYLDFLKQYSEGASEDNQFLGSQPSYLTGSRVLNEDEKVPEKDQSLSVNFLNQFNPQEINKSTEDYSKAQSFDYSKMDLPPLVQDNTENLLSNVLNIKNNNDPLSLPFQLDPNKQVPINSDKIIGSALGDLTQNDVLMQRLKALQVQQDKADKAIGRAEDSKIKGEQELRRMQLMSQQNLGNAQGAANQNQLLAGLLRAGLTTGAAIGRTKADYSGVEGLEKNANQPVENTKESENSLLNFQKLIQNEKLTEEQIAARKETAKLNKEFMMDKINTARENLLNKTVGDLHQKSQLSILGGRAPASVLQRKVDAAQQVLNLIPDDPKKWGDLYKVHGNEMAVGLATMLSPTGQPSQAMIAKFMAPETGFTAMQEGLQYITGNQQSRHQDKYVGVMKDMLEREMGTDQGLIKQHMTKYWAPYKGRPEIYNNPIAVASRSAAGVTDDLVDKMNSGKATSNDFMPENLRKTNSHENKQLNTVGGRILVSKNGHRVYIDPSDLDAAQKDGYTKE